MKIDSDEKNELIVDVTGFRTVKKKPTSEELSSYYNNYLKNEKNRPKNYQDSYDSRELAHIKLLNELCLYSVYKARPLWHNISRSMLDAGVGEGFMLARAKEKGWKVSGIDFSDYAIRKFNPSIIDDIQVGNAFEILNDMIKSRKKFDVCLIQNVLEHVTEPRKLMKDLSSLLSHEGILVMTIPNDFNKIQMKALEAGLIKHEFWVQIPEHLNYFNTTNIKTFVNELGLKIIDMYATFPIDIFLLHSGSNYIYDQKNGKDAHQARVEIDLLMSESGLEEYHKLCQSFVNCGIARNFTILLEL